MAILKNLDPSKFGSIVPAREAAFSAAPANPLPEIYPVNAIAKQLHPEKQYLKVVKVQPMGPMFVVYELAPDPERGTEKLAWFKAGSCICIYLDIDGYKTSRTYTLTSSPGKAANGIYRLIIMRFPDGKCSNWIVDNWKVGTEVVASEPLGKMNYNPIRDGKTVICLAGSINAFLSMAGAVAEGIDDYNLIIIYEAESTKFLLMKEELDALAAACDKIKVVYTLTAEDKEGFEKGGITADLIRRVAPEGSWSVFYSGPPPFSMKAKAVISELGIEPKWARNELNGELHNAEFFPTWPGKHQRKVPDTVNITVKIRDKVQTVSGSSRDTILQILEANGVAAPSKCRSGECSYCHSKLNKGEVYCPEPWEMRKEADFKYGYIHPCCTFALEDIEIEIPYFQY